MTWLSQSALSNVLHVSGLSLHPSELTAGVGAGVGADVGACVEPSPFNFSHTPHISGQIVFVSGPIVGWSQLAADISELWQSSGSPFELHTGISASTKVSWDVPKKNITAKATTFNGRKIMV